MVAAVAASIVIPTVVALTIGVLLGVILMPIGIVMAGVHGAIVFMVAGKRAIGFGADGIGCRRRCGVRCSGADIFTCGCKCGYRQQGGAESNGGYGSDNFIEFHE